MLTIWSSPIFHGLVTHLTPLLDDKILDLSNFKALQTTYLMELKCKDISMKGEKIFSNEEGKAGYQQILSFPIGFKSLFSSVPLNLGLFG